jgi:hypothetical protein
MPCRTSTAFFVCIFAVPTMKKGILILFFILVTGAFSAASAQCSICSRTVAQMGEKPARGLNAGILYLAFAPLALMGVISYRWWKKNRDGAEEGTPEELPMA